MSRRSPACRPPRRRAGRRGARARLPHPPVGAERVQQDEDRAPAAAVERERRQRSSAAPTATLSSAEAPATASVAGGAVGQAVAPGGRRRDVGHVARDARRSHGRTAPPRSAGGRRRAGAPRARRGRAARRASGRARRRGRASGGSVARGRRSACAVGDAQRRTEAARTPDLPAGMTDAGAIFCCCPWRRGSRRTRTDRQASGRPRFGECRSGAVGQLLDAARPGVGLGGQRLRIGHGPRVASGPGGAARPGNRLTFLPTARTLVGNAHPGLHRRRLRNHHRVTHADSRRAPQTVHPSRRSFVCRTRFRTNPQARHRPGRRSRVDGTSDGMKQYVRFPSNRNVLLFINLL